MSFRSSCNGPVDCMSDPGYLYLIRDDGTVTILKYTGKASELCIPDRLDGHLVSGIGENAFLGCNELKSVTFPTGAVDVGANPFTDCALLESIHVAPEHPTLAAIDGVLFGKPDKRLICYPKAAGASSYSVPQGTRVIGDSAFSGCENLKSVTLPEGVRGIGDFAFSGCENLRNITLADGMTVIGAHAFEGCVKLADVSLQNGLTDIGDFAFMYCKSLTRVTLPDSVTGIGINPFVDCNSLRTVEVSPEHPAFISIDGVLFEDRDKRLVCYPKGAGASSYSVPMGTRVIGALAFSGCDDLKSITLPEGVTDIGLYAFEYCGNLKKVTLPNSLRSIGDDAFASCTRLKSITIPSAVTDIGTWTFHYCATLTITVEEGSYAERYCEENGLDYRYINA